MTRIPSRIVSPIVSRIATSFAVVGAPAVALAHPDHASGGDFGLLHFATDPFHVGITGAVVLLFLAGRSLLRRRAVGRRIR
jgi:hypothetical protein